MRVRVKICGITSIKDALDAVKIGADAIGLVFHKPSPRYVSIETAAAISAAIPPFVSTVGLFVNADQAKINAIINHVGLDTLQFHGDEAEEDCKQFSLPYLKAIRVKSDTDLLQCAIKFKTAKALLLDTYSELLVGGTGLSFNWDVIPKNLPKPIVLAGGLHAENIKMAINKVKPYAVDVSGGVEKAKGVKDASKIDAFIRAVKESGSY